MNQTGPNNPFQRKIPCGLKVKMTKQDPTIDNETNSLDALRAIFPVEIFSDRELGDIVPMSEIYRYPEGAVLISEGEPSDGKVFFILSGSISVSIQGKFILRLKNRGESVGEMGLISSAPRSATVKTDISSTILVIDAAPHFAVDPSADYKFQYYLSRIFNSILTEKLRQTSDRAKLYEEMFTKSKGLEKERVGLEMEISRYLEQISLFTHLVNSARDVILVVDTNGVILNANDALSNAFEIETNQVVGIEVATLFGLPDIHGRAWPDLAEKARSKGWSEELVIYHPSMGQIPVDCAISAVHDVDNTLLAYSVIIRDIRGRKALEAETERQREELEQAYRQLRELDRAKSNFLNLVSHELRTPLSSILAYGELLTTEGMTEPEDQEQFIQIIYQEAGKLNDMVEKVLAISKMETGQMMFNFSENSLEDVVRFQVAMLRPQAEEKGLVIRFEVPDSLNPLVFDEDSIKEVLSQIVGNAIKFSEDGPIEVSLSQTSESSCIQVKDRGIGLDGKDFDEFLDAFAKGGGMNVGQHGLGLGLPLCYLILKSHLGSLHLKGNENGGATASIVIPNNLSAEISES